MNNWVLLYHSKKTKHVHYLIVPRSNTRKSYWGPLFLLLKQVLLVCSSVRFIASLHSWISSVSEYIRKAREELTNPQRMQHSYSLRKCPWPLIFFLNYYKLWSNWKECCNSHHRRLEGNWCTCGGESQKAGWDGYLGPQHRTDIKFANGECSIPDKQSITSYLSARVREQATQVQVVDSPKELLFQFFIRSAEYPHVGRARSWCSDEMTFCMHLTNPRDLRYPKSVVKVSSLERQESWYIELLKIKCN